MRIAVFVLGLGLIAAPALAADDEAAPKPKDDGDKVICKTETIPNSRFTKKTCMRKADWDQRTETAMRAFREVQNRTQTYGGKGN